jgi:hypothetical protein
MLTSTAKDAMAISVQADMACPPVFVNDGVQTIVPPRHTAHVGIQTEVVEQATAMSETGTQCDPVNIRTVISLSTFIISPCKVTIDTDIPKSSPTAPPQVYIPPENFTPAATSVSQALHLAGKAEENKTPEPISPESLHDGPCTLGPSNILVGRNLSDWSADKIDCVADFLDSLGSGSASDSMHAPKGSAAHQSICVPVSKPPSPQIVPLRTLSNFETAKHGFRLTLPWSGSSHQYSRPQAACFIPSLATFPAPVNPPFTLPLKDAITTAHPFIPPRSAPVASGGSLGAPVRSTLGYGKPGLYESIHASEDLPRSRVDFARISPMSILAPSKENAVVAIVLPTKRRGHRPFGRHAMLENNDVIDWARA